MVVNTNTLVTLTLMHIAIHSKTKANVFVINIIVFI